MSERWRKPAKIEAIEPGSDGTTVTIAGRRYAEPDKTYDSETVERIRLGYICIQCLEPHEQPLPEYCSLCGFEMRLLQPLKFAEDFKGELWLGPRESIADELEGLDERLAKKREQDARLRRLRAAGVVIPTNE
jgi:hypothetical protein